MSTWARSELWQNKQVSQLVSKWRSVMGSHSRRESSLQVWSVVLKSSRRVVCWLGWRVLRIHLWLKLDSWGTRVCHRSLSHFRLKLSRHCCLRFHQFSRLWHRLKSLKNQPKLSKSHQTHPLQLNNKNHKKSQKTQIHHPIQHPPKTRQPIPAVGQNLHFWIWMNQYPQLSCKQSG